MKGTGILLLHLVFLIPYTVNGQGVDFINRTLQDFAAELRFVGSSTSNNITDGVKETIEGSEYLNDIFIKGEIFTRSSERFSGIPMHYNALEVEIEVQMPDGI